MFDLYNGIKDLNGRVVYSSHPTWCTTQEYTKFYNIMYKTALQEHNSAMTLFTEDDSKAGKCCQHR